MSTDLLKQIDDLVASKTFNLDALDGIKKLKDDLGRTLGDVEHFKRELEKAEKKNQEMLNTNAWQAQKIETLNKKIADGEERVSKATDSIHEAAKHKAVAEAWQGAMAMVFKPNAVRETVQRNHSVWVPGPSGGGYAQAVSNTDNIVREDA
jgi:chromosome segregation ATPase